MEAWPAQLRQMVLILMADPTPSVVYWGSEQTIVYNEAYVPLIGQKHPSLQGQDPKIGFAEIWDQFDKIIKDGEETGQTTVGGKQFLLLQRYGFLEETYFSWKFIPVIGEEGFVVASYATVVEVTREVISDRRMATIRMLGQHMSTARQIKDVWLRLLSGLEHNDKDVPLALLYSVQKLPSSPSKSSGLDEDINTNCTLEGTLGMLAGHATAPPFLELGSDSDDLSQTFRDALKIDGPLLLQKGGAHPLPAALSSVVEWRGFGVPCTSAVVCPIRSGSSESLIGFLFLALNPRKPYDADYQDFVHLVTKQITSPHISAVLLREEVRLGDIAAEQAKIERAELSKQLRIKTLAYEQSEVQFSRFADRVAVGFGVIDPEGYVIYGNDSWFNMLGYDRHSTEPMSWVDSVIPEDRPIVLANWDALFIEKKAIRNQLRFIKPWVAGPLDRNGNMQFTTGLCAAYPDLNEDGSVNSLMSCIMDISELKWTEEQVRVRTQELGQSELRYRQFADYAPVGVCLLDHQGCTKFANDAWFAITGQSREDTESMSWLKPFHPEDIAKMRELFSDLKSGKGPLTMESRLQRLWRAGDAQQNLAESHAWVLASAYPELHPNGVVKDIVCWLTDISAQKASEINLQIRMDEALEMKRQQENFIDMTSHEIRNPLSAVLHCAEEIIVSMGQYLLQQSLTTSADPRALQSITGDSPTALDALFKDTVEAAQTIAYCVHHQKRIVDDVLTLSKLDSNLLTITPTHVQPTKVVRDALKIFEGELKAADIHFELVEHHSLRDMGVDWLLLDPSRVLQVLINLTTNAIKFTRGEPIRRITVTLEVSSTPPSKLDGEVEYFPQRRETSDTSIVTHKDGEGIIYLSLAVQDTGCGLSREETKMLFNRFRQGSPKTHVQYGGSGLGLFISRQLTEMQGGEIGVASERGKGSKFMFFIRTCRTSAPPKYSSDVDLSVRNGSNGRSNEGLEASTSLPLKLSPVNAAIVLLDNPKVLVVEDNLVNQKVLSKQLRKRGCKVEVANHGGEALEALQKTPSWKGVNDGQAFDVILMDLEMPIMNGIQCVGKIRELEASGCLRGHVQVIAVTASVRNEHVKAAMDAGMDDVTTKPYKIDDVLLQIHQITNKRRAGVP